MLERVAGAWTRSDGPFHEKGPVHVRALICCATMYLLREV